MSEAKNDRTTRAVLTRNQQVRQLARAMWAADEAEDEARARATATVVAVADKVVQAALTVARRKLSQRRKEDERREEANR